MSTPSRPRAANPDSVAFVIFGVTGDLTHRKLTPALYQLLLAQRLPAPLYIIGFARRDWNDEKLRQEIRQGVEEFSRTQPVDKAALDKLVENACYIQSSFDDPHGYEVLSEVIEEIRVRNVIYYLATPPEAFSVIIEQIGSHHLARNADGWRRIVIEKPYGVDLASAEELDREIHKVFREGQIFRIDHYLGKETVQNILVFRFANGIFEPLWNRRYVDHVQVTVSETVGVGTRAGYYDKAGVIRDMFQNHLMQLLTLTAMEAPVAFNADSVRDEKVKVLRSLRPWMGDEALQNSYRAQYVSGVIDGERVPGYKEEPGVPITSTTETLLAARLLIDNWRWSGVPFYLRSGKRLPRTMTEVAIHFRQVPLSLFDWRNFAGSAPNVLVLKLQPDEGITLTFGAKAPGPTNTIDPVSMNFSYSETFGAVPPEAYERLLQDVLTGDATLFTRSDEVLAAWGFVSNILEAWEEHPVRNLPVYEAGTWGPPGLDDFIARDGRQWRKPT